MVRLTRAIEFSTSLRYALAGLSERENRQRFGPRARQHGHNYRLEVTVRGEPDPRTGMVVDLKIMERFDHRDLNCDTDYFEKQLPTPENFVRVIREILADRLPGGVVLDRLRLQPDADTWVDWIEDETRP